MFLIRLLFLSLLLSSTLTCYYMNFLKTYHKINIYNKIMIKSVGACVNFNRNSKTNELQFTDLKLTDNYIWEFLKIWPTTFLLHVYYECFFLSLKPTLNNFQNNVCFLDTSINSNTSKWLPVSCDWCSLNNGIIETSKQNIIKNLSLIDEIDFDKFSSVDVYFKSVLKDRKYKISDNIIHNWCLKTFNTTSDKLLLFSSVYLNLEQIELRWCPFKRSKKSYYRNKDMRFHEPTYDLEYEIGKILQKHETITCNNCPKIINQHISQKFKYSDSYTHSVFQELLDLMIQDLK